MNGKGWARVELHHGKWMVFLNDLLIHWSSYGDGDDEKRAMNFAGAINQRLSSNTVPLEVAEKLYKAMKQHHIHNENTKPCLGCEALEAFEAVRRGSKA